MADPTHVNTELMVATDEQTNRGATNAKGKGDLTKDPEHPPNGAGVLGGRIPRREITRREDHQLFEVKPF